MVSAQSASTILQLETAVDVVDKLSHLKVIKEYKSYYT